MRIHVKKWAHFVADLTQRPPAPSLSGVLFTDHIHTHTSAGNSCLLIGVVLEKTKGVKFHKTTSW